MKHPPFAIAIIGLMLVGPAAHALDPVNQSIMNKRHVAGCMIKRMRSDRTVSYLDAKKTCIDEVKAQNLSLASSVSSARGEHPPAATVEPGS
jgi:hypothetical protein